MIAIADSEIVAQRQICRSHLWRLPGCPSIIVGEQKRALPLCSSSVDSAATFGTPDDARLGPRPRSDQSGWFSFQDEAGDDRFARDSSTSAGADVGQLRNRGLIESMISTVGRLCRLCRE